MRIQLRSYAIDIRREGVDLLMPALNRYIAARVAINGGNDRVLFAEYPVRHAPELIRATLKKKKGVIIATVFENVDGKMVISSYPNYIFAFSRNNSLLR